MRNTVLITGGTSGIGLALAEAFMRQGALVAVCARSQAALDSFRVEHPHALTIAADVTNLLAQQTLLDVVGERFGGLDILVNNAGWLIERDFAAGVADRSGLADEIKRELTATMQLTAATLAR